MCRSEAAIDLIRQQANSHDVQQQHPAINGLGRRGEALDIDRSISFFRIYLFLSLGKPLSSDQLWPISYYSYHLCTITISIVSFFCFSFWQTSWNLNFLQCAEANLTKLLLADDKKNICHQSSHLLIKVSID